MLKYKILVLGEMQTNCYLVWDDITKEAVVIDAADAGVEISDEIQNLGLKPLSVLATHGHFDHMMGALELMMIFNIPLAASSLDLFLLNKQQETATHFLKHKIVTPNIIKINIDLNKAISVRLGEEKLTVMKTPGHTPGGICFYSAANKLLFTGDIMFADGTVGDTNHAYSSMVELRSSLRRLTELPKNTIVLPGHGSEGTIESCLAMGSN